MESQNQPSNYQFFKTLAIGFSIVSFVIAIGVGGYILGTKQNPVIFPSPGETGNKPLPSTMPNSTDETANWKTYTLTKVDIQFKLPPEITKEGEYVENLLTADKGTNICFQLREKASLRIIPLAFAGGVGACGDSRSSLLIGGTSVDFEAGRGGTFTDHQGYKIENGKFYGKFPGNKTFEILSDVVEEVKNPNGMAIIKVKGKKYEEGGPLPFIYEGEIGALINTKGPLYPGLAVKMKLTTELNEQLFDQILSTFRFD
ncbi:MAG: hypothetical protein Q7S38_00015 [bacterium]|nr:hypothetical protein [bacterium]